MTFCAGGAQPLGSLGQMRRTGLVFRLDQTMYTGIGPWGSCAASTCLIWPLEALQCLHLLGAGPGGPTLPPCVGLGPRGLLPLLPAGTQGPYCFHSLPCIGIRLSTTLHAQSSAKSHSPMELPMDPLGDLKAV